MFVEEKETDKNSQIMYSTLSILSICLLVCQWLPFEFLLTTEFVRSKDLESCWSQIQQRNFLLMANQE